MREGSLTVVTFAWMFAAGCSTTVVGAPGTGDGNANLVGADGGGGSGGAPGSTSTGAGLSGQQNAACNAPTPAPMPGLPAVNSDAGGRPNFDTWRDLSCGSAPEVCTSAADCAGGNGACLHYQGGQGICDYGDADLWCDGEGEAIGYADGVCWMCGPLQNHKDACCAGLTGFDCRAWPYPSDGKVGMVCARHEDCEAGLLCGASAGTGYGICQCPGTDSANLVPPAACFDARN